MIKCDCRLQSAYQAVIALESIDELQTLKLQQLCDSIHKVITDDVQLEEAFLAVHILSRLR